MRVSEVMSGDVEYIAPDAVVAEAAELMGEIDVGALPVGSPDDLQGIVTDRDILYRLVARRLDPGATPVREVMSSPVIACGPDDRVQEAMDLMAAHHVRRLAVRGVGGRVVGWVTLGDLSRRLLLDSETLQAALRQVTEAPG
jgi:CBS domain-containing protein